MDKNLKVATDAHLGSENVTSGKRCKEGRGGLSKMKEMRDVEHAREYS